MDFERKYKVWKFFDNIISPFVVFAEHVERFIWWGKHLRTSHDWDHYYLYEIIYLKLKRMEAYWKKYAMGLQSQKQLKNITKAKALVERLLNDSYSFYHDELDVKWGMLELLFDEPRMVKGIMLTRSHFTHKNVKTPEQQEQYQKEWKVATDKDSAQRRQDKDMFFKILEKHIDSWWD